MYQCLCPKDEINSKFMPNENGWNKRTFRLVSLSNAMHFESVLCHFFLAKSFYSPLFKYFTVCFAFWHTHLHSTHTHTHMLKFGRRFNINRISFIWFEFQFRIVFSSSSFFEVFFDLLFIFQCQIRSASLISSKYI